MADAGAQEVEADVVIEEEDAAPHMDGAGGDAERAEDVEVVDMEDSATLGVVYTGMSKVEAQSAATAASATLKYISEMEDAPPQFGQARPLRFGKKATNVGLTTVEVHVPRLIALRAQACILSC